MGMSRPSVLAIPGLLCDDFVWEPLVAALDPVADVTVVDVSRFDDLTDMARAASNCVHGPFHLVGHSLGARIALEIWRFVPERVRSLVILDTGVDPPARGERERRQVMIDLADTSMDALADAWLPPMVHPDRRTDDGFMAPLRDMIRRSDPARHARQITALLNRPDARPLLATITVPTLVVVGRQDEWSPVAQHERLASAVPGARLEVVEDSGHMVTVEQPEVVSSLLVDWLSDIERGRSPDC
jgi:pimeloyl-ACP methyl ester carboxylesterase